MIGNFTTASQLRAYKQMQKIENDVNFVKDVFQKMDNSRDDGNQNKGNVVLDRASYSYDSQGTREKFSDITGALLTNGNNTSFEGSLLHRQEQFILQPFPEFNRGRLDVSMTETAESVSYSSSQGKVVLDKATGTRTLF